MCFCGISVARTRKFVGRVFAYVPDRHVFKVASFSPNQEIVVFRIDENKKPPVYVKLVFVSFGTQQVADNFLKGEQTMAVKARRSKECDEKSPRFFAPNEEVVERGPPDNAGVETLTFKHKFRITESFLSEVAPEIKDLRCYLVEMPKQQ